MAEPQTHHVHGQGCNTKFNGVDGEHGKSASLWLADMERYREKASSSSIYLQHMDRHLEGQAGQWVLNTPSVRRLVFKAYDGSATDSDIEFFHEALTQRFKVTVEEALAMRKSSPYFDLLSTKQRASENLEQYCNRFLAVLIALHHSDGNKDTLTSLEVVLLGTAVDRFVRGLSSRVLQRRLLEQQILHRGRSPYKVYKMVKAQIRVMDMEAEAEKVKEKGKELKRKRTLATDEDEEEEEERSMIINSMILKLKLPTPTQNNEPHPRSDVGEKSLSPRHDEKEVTHSVTSSKRLPAPPKSKPALGAKPVIKSNHSAELQPTLERRYLFKSRGSLGEEGMWLGN